MKTILTAAMICMLSVASLAAESISMESAPPVVVETSPVAGSTAVDASVTEVRVRFSKSMKDGSWSWSTWGTSTFPKTAGNPRYLEDGCTCVLPVSLEPGRFYAIWLNSQKFQNFQDRSGRPAVPYLLTFSTASDPG